MEMVKSDEAALYEGGEKSMPLNYPPFSYVRAKSTTINRLSESARREYYLYLLA
jgi:hypothetical protein